MPKKDLGIPVLFLHPPDLLFLREVVKLKLSQRNQFMLQPGEKAIWKRLLAEINLGMQMSRNPELKMK